MKWQLKAAALGSLSTVPGGRRLYRRLQDVSRSNRLDIHNQYRMKSKFLSRMRESGIEIRGSKFVEVGTGWYPLLPLLLRLAGASSVVTLDLNPWLTRRSLAELARGLKSIAPQIEEDFSLEQGECDDVIDRMEAHSLESARSPKESLRRVDITYRMPCDACRTGIEDNSVDYVVSSNVLEHVPPGVIQGMISESRRYLREDGGHAHHIDLGDHFAFDKAISKANFLKYSRRYWGLMGGGGLGYVNRLRRSEYVRLFVDGGFDIHREYSYIDPRALAEIKSGALRIDRGFSAFSDEDNATTLLDVFARRAGNESGRATSDYAESTSAVNA